MLITNRLVLDAIAWVTGKLSGMASSYKNFLEQFSK